MLDCVPQSRGTFSCFLFYTSLSVVYIPTGRWSNEDFRSFKNFGSLVYKTKHRSKGPRCLLKERKISLRGEAYALVRLPATFQSS